MSADPITVLVLTAMSGRDPSPAVLDGLAASIRLRIETLVSARHDPLSEAQRTDLEFAVATELMTLGIAMMARLPEVDLTALHGAIAATIADMGRMRMQRGGG
jgi:hypothetical protein